MKALCYLKCGEDLPSHAIKGKADHIYNSSSWMGENSKKPFSNSLEKSFDAFGTCT